jgi:hypothetical protein
VSVRRGFLQGLEEGVGCVRGSQFKVRDHRYLVAALQGGEGEEAFQLPYLVDLDPLPLLLRLDEDEIRVIAAFHAPATGAASTGTLGGGGGAEESLGHEEGEGAFAHALRSCDQHSVGKLARHDRLAELAHGPRVADDGPEVRGLCRCHSLHLTAIVRLRNYLSGARGYRGHIDVGGVLADVQEHLQERPLNEASVLLGYSYHRVSGDGQLYHSCREKLGTDDEKSYPVHGAFQLREGSVPATVQFEFEGAQLVDDEDLRGQGGHQGLLTAPHRLGVHDEAFEGPVGPLGKGQGKGITCPSTNLGDLEIVRARVLGEKARDFHAVVLQFLDDVGAQKALTRLAFSRD